MSMAREIKFRGKVSKTKQWVYGDLLHVSNGCIITTNSELGETLPDGDIGLAYSLDEFAVVIPETVGQFTGLLDKNEKEIYEGDIIKTKRYGVVHGQSNTQGADLFRVVYENAQFYIDNKLRHFYLQDSRCNEVIGNVFDNPELLEGGAE